MAPNPCESRSRSRNWRVAVSVSVALRGAVQHVESSSMAKGLVR
jgi:hypothetical protein